MRSVKGIRKIFVSVIWPACLFATSAFGQDCETYDLHGVVVSEQGKPIKGAVVDLLDIESRKSIKLNRWGKPMPKTTSSRDGSYGISVIDLPNYTGDKRSYLIRVTAAGFVPYEQKVDIEQCGLKLDVKLAKTK